MKLSVIPLFALLTAIPAAMALPEPFPARAAPAAVPTLWNRAAADKSSGELAKRDNAAIVLVEEIKYRICPRTTHDCPSLGQYKKDTRLVLHCYTRDDTTPINGDYGWGQVVTNDHAYWVALAWGKYVSWEGLLPYCIAVGSSNT